MSLVDTLGIIALSNDQYTGWPRKVIKPLPNYQKLY